MAPPFASTLSVCTVLLVATALTPLAVDGKDHQWACCSTKQNPFEVTATEDINFQISAGRGDVWELTGKAAFDGCDFNGATKHNPNTGNANLVTVKASGNAGTRYFASKEGLMGNACNVDEWPLRVAVSVKEAETGGLGVTPKKYSNKFKAYKNKLCAGAGGKKLKMKKPAQCKKKCLKAKGCTGYDFSKKRKLPERCIIFTDPNVKPGNKKPKTACYVRLSAASQAS